MLVGKLSSPNKSTFKSLKATKIPCISAMIALAIFLYELKKKKPTLVHELSSGVKVYRPFKFAIPNAYIISIIDVSLMCSFQNVFIQPKKRRRKKKKNATDKEHCVGK